MCFSDSLPPCLISLNNLDSYVYVNTVSGSVGWHSPLVRLGWHHSISRAWIFNSPIIANHAFHPFDTSQRLSLSGDWWWQHVLLCCCFLLSKRQCKGKKSPRAWIAIISAPIAAALSAYSRHLLWPRSSPRAESDISRKKKSFPQWVLLHSARELCFSRNVSITKILSVTSWK